MPSCKHLSYNHNVVPRTPNGCEECLKMGDRWVHLRMCLECGHVGCCDSSKNKHATKHFHALKHPIMRSVEPGELLIAINAPALEEVQPDQRIDSYREYKDDHQRQGKIDPGKIADQKRDAQTGQGEGQAA